MKIGVMQPYFMPYIGYFQLIKSVDRFVILDDVNYIKRGWSNRNYIIVNGARHRFTISLRGASQNKRYTDIELSDDFKRFLKTIEYAYKRSDCYAHVISLIKNVCSCRSDRFSELAISSLRDICSYLSIDTEILLSSELSKHDGLKGVNRIIDICRMLGGDIYINLPGGVSLYDREIFAGEGIELKFLQPSFGEYHQPGVESFIGGLSIIDVLMNNRVEDVNILLQSYKLK